jgi:hypothetical protein
VISDFLELLTLRPVVKCAGHIDFFGWVFPVCESGQRVYADEGKNAMAWTTLSMEAHSLPCVTEYGNDDDLEPGSGAHRREGLLPLEDK